MFLEHQSGMRVPALGLGTFRLTGRTATDIVLHALDLGYRHIDTAQMYDNEAEVGEALRQTTVPRDRIWLTTKIWPDDYRAGDLQRSVEGSLQRLGSEPDLLLLHWPSRQVPLAETMQALNEVQRRGWTRCIGLSNFTTQQIDHTWSLTDVPLIGLQIEYHPFLEQDVVLDKARQRGMLVTAYSPLAQGKVYEEPVLQRIGEAHGKTPGQVALRWLLQQPGIAAIPRSSRKANVEANLAALDITLSDEDMLAISALGSRDGRLVSPASVAPEWD